MEDWLATVVGIGAVQGLFLASWLIFVKKNNRPANQFLGAFVGLYSLFLLNGVLKSVLFLPHLHMVGVPMSFMLGPTYYFYVKSLTDSTYRPTRTQLSLHLIPSILVTFYLLPFYILPAAEKVSMVEVEQGFFPGYFSGRYIVQIVHSTVYFICATLALQTFRGKLKNQFSNIDRINLNWLLFLTIIFAAYIVLVIVDVLTGEVLFPGWIFPLVPTLVFYAIGYAGLVQPKIFDGVADLPSNLSKNNCNAPTPAYQKSGLDARAIENFKSQLLAVMEKEKPFKDANLTLAKLAKATGMPEHNVSQVINVGFEKNFFDFVNSYRVHEATILLRKGSGSIMDIAYEVGFNSKSTFYSAFKRETGVTPGNYK